MALEPEPEIPPVLDAHVHFWDPAVLRYPWLSDLPQLSRAHLPAAYAAASAAVPVQAVLFVEANPRAGQGVAEAEWVAALADASAPVAGIVALVDLCDADAASAALDRLGSLPRVVGARHNIQGNPPGFSLQPLFVEGVREVGRRGLCFDLCCTHQQLPEVLELARRTPETRLVLDHCGKPGIRERRLDPWREHVAALAELEHVCCKISGLLTEAAPGPRETEDLLPYAEHVVDRFGVERVLYGSDWPVLTLAGTHAGWYHFTRRLTRQWSRDEARAFYRDNARRVYRIP